MGRPFNDDPVVQLAFEPEPGAFAGSAPAVLPGAGPDMAVRELGLRLGVVQEPYHTLVHATVVAPTALTRHPVDIICVLDVSGSMGCLAANPDDATAEADNLSRLDLVKHSVKTVVAALQDDDQIAVITFSNTAKTHFPLRKMDVTGRSAAADAVSGLCTEGRTEMWKGIEAGLTLAAATATPGRTTAMMLLTDGEPSDAGHIGNLDGFLARHSGLLAQVGLSTFGFGYNLNSKLLDDIANKCGGMFTFIPDASIVGTAFVNSLSNTLATAHQGVEVDLTPGPGYEIATVYGQHVDATCDKAAGAVSKMIGPVLFGQDRSVVVGLRRVGGGDASSASSEAELLRATVRTLAGEVSGAATVGQLSQAPVLTEAAALYTEKHRLEFGTVVAEQLARGATSVDDRAAAAAAIARYVSEIKASPATAAGGDASVRLVEDLEGQVTEALSKEEWFRKWGRHYLPSLSRAHLLQQCTNFKDPGLQHYGGPIFKAEQEKCDDIFVSLPPPEPERRSHGGSYGGSHGGSHAPINMGHYYNSGGGCFAGDCTVQVAGGGTKRVDTLRRGDRVVSATGGLAMVTCVVKSRCAGGVAELVTLPGGARLTEYHPVRLASGEWAFPRSIAPTAKYNESHVYNLVLESGHVAKVNGTECVTLGHGFTEDVVAHPFFGSEKVVDDLKAQPGWVAGVVVLEPTAFVRSAVTNQVCSIRRSELQLTVAAAGAIAGAPVVAAMC